MISVRSYVLEAKIWYFADGIVDWRSLSHLMSKRDDSPAKSDIGPGLGKLRKYLTSFDSDMSPAITKQGLLTQDRSN